MKNLKALSKNEIYQQELEKIIEIFKEVEEPQRKLADGLIQETAYLKAELYEMHKVINEVGLIKIHKTDKSKQKALPIANEYRRTANIYALNIKTLNSILMKNVVEGEDEVEAWLKSRREQNE